MDAITKNAAISARILAARGEGMSTRDAIDHVLGAGTHARIAAELYTALRARSR